MRVKPENEILEGQVRVGEQRGYAPTKVEDNGMLARDRKKREILQRLIDLKMQKPVRG